MTHTNILISLFIILGILSSGCIDNQYISQETVSLQTQKIINSDIVGKWNIGKTTVVFNKDSTGSFDTIFGKAIFKYKLLKYKSENKIVIYDYKGYQDWLYSCGTLLDSYYIIDNDDIIWKYSDIEPSSFDHGRGCSYELLNKNQLYLGSVNILDRI